jgi:hypothetical protein
MQTPLTIKELIKLGGNLKLKGTYQPFELKEFISLVKLHDTQLTIDAKGIETYTLKELAKLGGKNLTLEI